MFPIEINDTHYDHDVQTDLAGTERVNFIALEIVLNFFNVLLSTLMSPL